MVPNIPEGWEELFRPMTPAEQLRLADERRFMEQEVYAGLKNLNTGFDSPSIHHFSPTEFGIVIDRCERLQVHVNGIEVFTDDGGFIECVFAMDDGSPDRSYDWARRLVQRYQGTRDITLTATFSVPDLALASRLPTSDLGPIGGRRSEELRTEGEVGAE
jgi:hypothetical protein